ncbi:L-cystine transporter [Thalassotalea aquiviva]|uniref:L-cystine transporter n=1 Tax=Thalassotalea aquiviva TaxID=3242415 RepID=UPI00352BC474
MSLTVILNLLVFLFLLLGIYKLQKQQASLAKTVLLGLIVGSGFGLGLQLLYAPSSEAISTSLEWINILGQGYVNLLKMIVMPLVLISMIAAVVKLDTEEGNLGKISAANISILLITTAVAALVGIVVANAFGLSAHGLIEGSREIARMEVLQSKQSQVEELSIPQMLVSFIPVNPFADLSGLRSTSVIAVVIFGILFGLAARKVGEESEQLAAPIKQGVIALQSIIMRLVKMIMALTPYGIAALMTQVVASSNLSDMLSLLEFIVASYVAIAIMFLIHGLLVSLVGVSIKEYFVKVWPVLTFAFSSRSSAATIPLNVQTQVQKLKVPESVANLAASFGATIGQNGCAGIYPAMLAVMVAPSVGINPMEIEFILSLIAITVISSFGIAGVGGGATFAALIVLPAMGLPVAIAALLISIEPLIDMARTALNVSGAMTAGTLTSRWLKLEQQASDLESEQGPVRSS